MNIIDDFQKLSMIFVLTQIAFLVIPSAFFLSQSLRFIFFGLDQNLFKKLDGIFP